MVLSTPRIPARLCLYAIGDIHGHKDKLAQLLEMIAKDAATHKRTTKRLVFLGDYIDRGPDSKGVIELLLCKLPKKFEAVFLRGNHENTLLHILNGEKQLIPLWMQFGGATMLASYGVNPFSARLMINPEKLVAALNQKLPDAHRHFLRDTIFSYGCGDYLFAHAGVRPNVELDKQSNDDLIWIRDEFLASQQDFGKIIVHGHSISAAPDIRPNRIGIDTGAYATGRLTCLKLFGDQRAFLTT